MATFGWPEFMFILRSAGWKFGRWLDVVLMQRALGHGDARPVAEGA